MKKFILLWMLSVVTARAQQGEVLVSTEPELPSRAAEQKQFEYRKKALEAQPPGPQRDSQVKQEIQRHLVENKRISMQEQVARKEVISDLKQKWTQVESNWKAECTRHDTAKQQLESLPDGPAKTAQIEAENAAHRNTSKQIAAERNVVHEGVMKQANREVMGGQTGTSNGLNQTAGTSITDPNHRGMNGDFDAGGGYRTTEKAGKILNEIGVKGPNGGPVKITGGVLETAPEFGMTVNAAPGTDRIGSAGHQTQVKVGAQHGETYVSETGGAVNKGPLKDHLATLDSTKKAQHGSNAAPEKLVGGSPEGQVMAKGTLKAANSAGLAPETIEAIAAKNGVKNPGRILDTLAEIKTGRAAIATPEEAASLKKASRDILDAAETKSKTAAAAEVQAKQTQIADLEAKGMKTQAQQIRNEIADYNAKAKATTEAVRGPVEPVTKPGSASSKPGTTLEPEAKVSGGSKLVSGAGLILGVYGIYEGYGKAKEELEAKKQGEPQGALGWTKDKAELAGRTFWHGLGFGGMAEIGTQAGKDAFDQYKKDIAAGKISPNDWQPYLQMKGTALGGGLFAAGKAITYDAARQTGTNLGNAFGEGLGAGMGLFDQLKSARNEKQINEERSKEIYDKLIKGGASTMGAQRAADAVKNGDYTEAKRLDKVLEGKKDAKDHTAAEKAKAYDESLKYLDDLRADVRAYHERLRIRELKEKQAAGTGQKPAPVAAVEEAPANSAVSPEALRDAVSSLAAVGVTPPENGSDAPAVEALQVALADLRTIPPTPETAQTLSSPESPDVRTALEQQAQMEAVAEVTSQIEAGAEGEVDEERRQRIAAENRRRQAIAAEHARRIAIESQRQAAAAAWARLLRESTAQPAVPYRRTPGFQGTTASQGNFSMKEYLKAHGRNEQWQREHGFLK